MQKKKPLKQTAHHVHKKTKKHSLRFFHGLKFLPAVLFFASSIGLYQSALPHSARTAHSNVLSYATSISTADLHSQTNIQRSNNGVASLGLNSQLNNAAQVKANDMVARNYWSHTTPDGEEPWVFITNAGYQYQTAGENLAYGFDTSSATVTGWMNSAPHRQNLLNSGFTEVGFGFANSPNYVNDGQQTVVVAMYGAPTAQQAPAAPLNSAPTATPSAPPQTNSPGAAPAANLPARSTQQTPAAEVSPMPSAPQPQDKTAVAASAKTNASPAPKAPATAASVRRIQLLTGGNARWSETLLVASMCGVGVFWAFERSRQLKHFALASEHFIVKHLHVDLAVAGFITLGLALLQTSGLVR